MGARVQLAGRLGAPAEESVMTVGLGPISVAGHQPAPQPAARRPEAPSQRVAPLPPALPLRLPEESAFKVSTINQRLASLAGERGGRFDFKA